MRRSVTALKVTVSEGPRASGGLPIHARSLETGLNAQGRVVTSGVEADDPCRRTWAVCGVERTHGTVPGRPVRLLCQGLQSAVLAAQASDDIIWH